jgi:YidC/Oxa1 family membrane protein insertase
LQKKYPDYGKPPVPAEPVAEAPQSVVAESIAAPTSSPETPVAEPLTIENPVLKITTEGTSLRSVIVKNYREQPKKKAANVDLATEPIDVFPVADMQIQALQTISRSDERTLTWSGVSEDQWVYQTRFELSKDQYHAQVTVSAQNQSDKTRSLDLGLGMRQAFLVEAVSSGLIPSASSYHKKQLVTAVAGSRDSEELHAYCSDEDDVGNAMDLPDASIDFIGVDLHYFILSMIPASSPQSARIWRTAAAKVGSKCQVNLAIQQKQGTVKPGETIAVGYTVYLGPKDVDVMANASEKLREAVDFGWFGIIGRPLLTAIKAIEANLTFNFGLAIVLLTLLLKIAFYPLTRAAAVSMKSMQKYTPEINRIKEKYKDDKVTQQREMMAFMGKHKINPAKGCLPILPQIPVFIAFYNVLSQSIELRHAPFFAWIQDLSAADPYYITPVFLGAGMVLQQKLTPNPTMDKTQERIMLIVPAVFTVMMLSLPAGMVIYMLTNTIVSIGQQQWLNRTIKV